MDDWTDVPTVGWDASSTPTVTGSSGGGGGWMDSLADVAKYGLKSAIDKEFNTPFRTDPSGQYGMDPQGRLYLRGTAAGGLLPVGTSAMPWLIGGGLLLAVVVAVVLLND